MSKVVGIDLGTTNSLVAYVKDGVPVVIRDANGDGLVPSVVSVTAEGTVYVVLPRVNSADVVAFDLYVVFNTGQILITESLKRVRTG